MSHKPKILWPMVATVVIVAITILLAVSWQFINFVDDYNDDHLERTFMMLESELAAKEENAALISRFLASDNTIIHSLETSDTDALRSRLDVLAAEFGYDVFIITDASGYVVLQSGSENVGHNVAGQPSIQRALDGEHVATLDRGPAHNLQVISGQMAYTEADEPVGVVFIGFHIGKEEFFRELHAKTATDFFLYVDGYCVVSAVGDHMELCGEISETGRLAEERGEIVLAQSELEGQSTNAIYFPLVNDDGRVLGTLLIVRFMISRDAIVGNFIRSGVAITLVVLSFSLSYIVVRARRISQSIDLLSKEKASLEQSKKEAVRQREVYLRTLNDVAKTLLVSNLADDEEKLLAGMELIGKSLGADRVQIWQNELIDGELHFIMRYRWLSDLAQTKTNFPFGIRFPYKSKAHWLERLGRGECINSPFSDLPLEDKDIFMSYGILSFILMPLFLHGELVGFMKVDDCKSAQPASKEQMDLLSSAGHMFASFFDDIDQKKKIAEAEEQVKLMLDSSPFCCQLWDADFNMIDSNEATVALLGLDSKEEYMENFSAFNPEFQPDGERSVDKAKRLNQQALKEGALSFKWINLSKDGEEIPVEVTLVQVKKGKRPLLVSYARDLREHEQMTRQLEHALAEALSASKAKSDFLSVMSHEMRTPLSAITGMTHIAKSAADVPGKDQALDKIEDASQHLLGIVNNVLEMAQIEANKLKIVKGAFELDKLVEKVQTLSQFRMAEKRHHFTLVRDDKLSHAYVGDEQRILQVVTNLLTNAITYTPSQGKIQLELRLLKRQARTDEISFSVTDTGIGIEAAQQERLFQMFEQADNSASRKYGGTGLGLAISKRLIELMGGSRIQVDSQIGKGSTFSFTLVLPRSDVSESAEHPQARSPHHFIGKRVLIAEDVEINCEILSALLGDAGIESVAVQSGKEAVEALQKQPDRYDLVLMDIQMPGMDGVEATEKIRKLGHQIPILAMTANVFKEDIASYLARGMDDHIGKPIDIEELYGKLGKYLGK